MEKCINCNFRKQKLCDPRWLKTTMRHCDTKPERSQIKLIRAEIRARRGRQINLFQGA